MDYTILIAEDDKDIVDIIKLYMESEGYHILSADNGADAWEIVNSEKVDLAIIDIMMPYMNGYELTKKIRQIKNIPIIIMSAKSDDSDKILGLNLGADDYISKPFNPLELVARIAANLRRFYKLNVLEKDDKISKDKLDTIILGDLKLCTDKMALYKNEKEIMITPNEYKLLAYMMKSPGRVYTKEQLCELLNGEYYENYENSITVHISHLREKIEDNAKTPKYIKNIRGVGYKIEAPK